MKSNTKRSYIWLKNAWNFSSFLLICEQLKNYFNSFGPWRIEQLFQFFWSMNN
jgi:hypothetical protein